VSEGITRRAVHRPVTHLRGVMRAALAVFLLSIALASLAPPAPARAASSAPSSASAASLAARETHLRLAAWRYAVRQRGKPYVWGATGPYGYDCSGLVYASYKAAGFVLPRTTYDMLDSSRLVRIPKSSARRGDLAFFGTGHVELYDWGKWTFGAQTTGTLLGFHVMNVFWHPTMYFRIRL
jgi:cell wall-associated NlpC family hydrolase